MLRNDSCALVTARNDGKRGAALPLLVALHPRGGDVRSECERVRRLFGSGPDIVALQAARPCNPTQSDFRAARAYAGFSWYLGVDPSRPEAASFGDSLAQVESFASTIERAFVLVGDEQGAAIALIFAFFGPSGLAGVHMTRTVHPVIEGWTPPAERLDGIPFAATDREAAAQLSGLLPKRGAHFEVFDATQPRQMEQWLETLRGGDVPA